MTHILVLDDHPIVRHAIAQLVARDIPASVGEAEDASAALAALESRSWDLVILDLSLPGKTGLEVLAQIHRVRPNLPILVFSMYPEEQFAMRALRAGASGYLSKGCQPAALREAVQRILQGGRYLGEKAAERLLAEIANDPSRPPHHLLSSREFQVMIRIAGGRTVSEVAAELGLSVKTISTYRTRILEKMQMERNADLTQYAIRNGLLE